MEIAVIVILALIVLGPKRLPQAGRSIGQAVRELKKATSAARNDLGLDDVAADVKDLKASLRIDLNDADKPAVPAAAAATVTPAATAAVTAPAPATPVIGVAKPSPVATDQSEEPFTLAQLAPADVPGLPGESGPAQPTTADEPVPPSAAPPLAGLVPDEVPRPPATSSAVTTPSAPSAPRAASLFEQLTAADVPAPPTAG